MKELKEDFFKRNTVRVAKELLGKIIFVNNCSARIIETEAYTNDPASHAFKKTERSSIMYNTYAHIYIYLIYGMYYCINFTAEKTNKPGAVLIRALEPLTGIEEMQKRRNTKNIYSLCSGPGKLCQALKIDKTLNEKKLGKEIKIFDDNYKPEVCKSSRIGIKDALNLQWRFFIKNNKFVSKKMIFINHKL